VLVKDEWSPGVGMAIVLWPEELALDLNGAASKEAIWMSSRRGKIGDAGGGVENVVYPFQG
jgi:hypothetical protein